MNQIESKPKDLETVKGWLTIARENNNKLAIQIIENLFPEVPEVMNLRIKEAVLKMIHDTPSGELEDNYSVRKEEVIDWLEKQGEQKTKEKTKFYDSMDDLTADTLIKKIEGLELDDMEKYNFIYWIKSRMQNHSWSEEDERISKEIISWLKSTRYVPNDQVETLNSWITWIKKQKSKQYWWSQEDINMIQDAIHWIQEFQKSDRCKDENDMQNSVTCENWLKSTFGL